MSSPEFPLDYVTVAFVQEVDSSAKIIALNSLINQRIESTSLFTMGKLPSDFIIPSWALPVNAPVAVVLYFNITVQSNTAAPTTNVLHSLVYGDTNGATIPSLKNFGATTYAYDTTGKCSLSVCNGNALDIQLAAPSFDEQNDCTVQCSS